jgi:hypothetical protein
MAGRSRDLTFGLHNLKNLKKEFLSIRWVCVGGILTKGGFSSHPSFRSGERRSEYCWNRCSFKNKSIIVLPPQKINEL